MCDMQGMKRPDMRLAAAHVQAFMRSDSNGNVACGRSHPAPIQVNLRYLAGYEQSPRLRLISLSALEIMKTLCLVPCIHFGVANPEYW